MDRVKNPESSFSTSEYEADSRRVMAYAKEHGTAVVIGDDGKVDMVISIPTTSLPYFDPTK